MYLRLLTCGLLATVAAPGLASETVTYSYDAQGRMVDAAHAGTGPATGLKTQYQYDLAGNRLSQNVSQSSNKGQQVVALPLNGITIITMNP